MQQELLDYFQSLLAFAESRGSSLNSESQQALAQFISQFQEFLERQIAQQNQDNAINRQVSPSTSDISSAGMPSSNIEGFAYDDKNNRLLVRFLGDYPNRNGAIYSYEGVPPVIFDLLRKGAIPARTDGKNRWGKWWKGKVPSLGAAMFSLIKSQGYPYQRIS